MAELIISTERPDLVLKHVTEVEDLAWFMASRQYGHPLSSDQIGAPDHLNFEKLRKARQTSNPNYVETGIWHGENFIGFADLYIEKPDSTDAKVGYEILPLLQGRGYATLALRALTHHGFKERNLQKIEAHIKANNLASQRVAQKAGYRQAGRLLNKLIFTNTQPEY